ncbi:pyridoxal 5'-phosphate synthase PDX1-like 4 [Musa acuminata AAA Group]|uniref:pyridoxal 5'-phosphate synthase PDX1-like 4 n=1 Tax=Musa acuminata AAA Group TaxID=214697 RepID=UPI0031DA1558
MSDSGVVMVYGNGATLTELKKSSTFSVKVGLAQMLRGRVIMDVVTPEQARVVEEAGACAVMVLERVPTDIRAQGGVIPWVVPPSARNYGSKWADPFGPIWKGMGYLLAIIASKLKPKSVSSRVSGLLAVPPPNTLTLGGTTSQSDGTTT